MAYNHKVELSKPERFVGGDRRCSGCGAGILSRAVTRALDEKDKAVICNDTYKFLVLGGDGGTYDIGFQSLSGAMERGHDMVYFCYDNEAYMNTGIQRSSSTPRFANATTTPIGTESFGKKQNKKNLTEILAAHEIPYAAQTTFIGKICMKKPTGPSTPPARPSSMSCPPAPEAGSIRRRIWRWSARWRWRRACGRFTNTLRENGI